MSDTNENKTETGATSEQQGPSGAGQSTASPAGQEPDGQGVEKPATMEVPVDKMQAIMDQLAALQEKDTARDQEMDILRESVSRGRLEEAENKRKIKGPPEAKVMVHNNHIVVGWRLEKNELVYNPVNLLAPVSENLQIRLFYSEKDESGKRLESGLMNYVDFIRNKERAQVKKVGQNDIMWVVKFDDPNISMEELEIDPQFLNP